jgi:hypothetical protein
VTQRLNLYLEDDFAELLKARKPKSLSLSAFCAYLCEMQLRSLDSVAKLATCSAGAEDTTEFSAVHERIEPKEVQPDLTAVPAVKERSSSSPFGGVLGKGVGRESEGNPRKTPFKRLVRDELKPFEELIEDFWRIKGGSKGSRAWSLLNTELVKMLDAHGASVVEQQIQLAINGKWKGITLANYNRFDQPQKGQQQPELKHPAARVFTAKDGFSEPATNPVLKDLL